MSHSTRTFSRIAVAGLIALLLVALGLAWYFYQRDRQDYTELQRVRLDPMGSDTVWPTLPPGYFEDKRPVAVMFGDSRAQDWPTGEIMAGYRMVNRGIGGQTTAQVSGRFDLDVAPLDPDVVIIEVGINDLKTIPLFPEDEADIVNRCEANIKGIVAAAYGLRATVVLITIFPTGVVPIERWPVWSDRIPASIVHVNQFIAGQAGKGVVVMDGYSILADAHGQTRAEYSRDTLHINEQGYAALNVELEAVLSTIGP